MTIERRVGLRYSGRMQAILAVTIPFFALVLLGWLAARAGPLPESAIPGLNAYVLWFALPCMLFRLGAGLPLEKLADPVLLGLWLTGALVMVALAITLTLRRKGAPPERRVGLRDASFGALVAAFPNSGFMGVPLLVALFGDAAAGPVIGTMLIDMAITSSLCLALAEADGHHGQGLGRSLLKSLRGAAMNPLPWAIVLGAALGVSGWSLPGPVAQVIKLLGDSATPVALFTIGAVLWRAGQHAHTRTPPARYLPLAALKLFVHPALMLGLGLVARALGLPVSDFALMVLVLTAALPSASNVSLLAERYRADNGRVARIIMASTVMACASFSLIAWGWQHVRR